MEGENNTPASPPPAVPPQPTMREESAVPATPAAEAEPLMASPRAAAAPSSGSSWQMYLVVSLACLFFLFVAVASIYLFWPWPGEELVLAPVAEAEVQSGIGSELYERSINPLRSTFPEIGAGGEVANPIDDAYRNPFQ